MKQTFLSVILLSIVLAGCATTQPEATSSRTELISMTSLPSISAMYPMSGLKLNVLFHIRADGSIEEVRLMKSSGDPDWDKAAIDSMKLWRFTPFTDNQPTDGHWVRNTIVLQVQAPTILTLSEITASTLEEADSLYGLVQGGSDFDKLYQQIAPGSSEPRGKFLGATDVARYPKHVRDALRTLGINEVTKPLRIGGKFLLFKRYKPDGPDIGQQ